MLGHAAGAQSRKGIDHWESVILLGIVGGACRRHRLSLRLRHTLAGFESGRDGQGSRRVAEAVSRLMGG